jgi:hypothetical protein
MKKIVIIYKYHHQVIGITKIFHFDGSNTVTNNMFSVKYQLFLNDIYYWGSTELLTYAMVKTYLEDIDFLLDNTKANKI